MPSCATPTDGATVAEPELLDGRYEVVRTVSTGDRATVLQALDHLHDRRVALKVYPVGVGDDRDALLAEARLLMGVRAHPALPKISGDFFTDDGGRYVLVMDWIDGVDLHRALTAEGDPGLPLPQVLADLDQVAAALDHLHAQEPPVVHGDVKPANIVRTADGSVVLVDFDIAGAPGRTGTAGYAAPEVAAGEKPGPAADVFGLGATAVTLLNGLPVTEATPRYPGLDAGSQQRVSRALRAALAVNPARRPRSAQELVDQMRGARAAALPSGFVTLLATEVVGTELLWRDEPEGMRTAMHRLSDVRAEVVHADGGIVWTSINLSDAVAVFREPSAAARAALALHDRVARTAFPPGVDVRLRVSLAAGEADFVDGSYTGPLVDHVLSLRPLAAPGTTVVSESTAGLLLDQVGNEVSIVHLRTVVTPTRPQGTMLYCVTRPGEEPSAQTDEPPVPGGIVAASFVPDADSASADANDAPGRALEVSRAAAAGVAAQQPATLVSFTISGVALIYAVVLGGALGAGALALAVFVVAGLATAACFAWNYALAVRDQRAFSAAEQASREAEALAELVAREHLAARAQLDEGFERIASRDAREAARVLENLGDEHDAVQALLARGHDRTRASVTALVPNLTEEAYRGGMSALSDALGLLEESDGARRRRVEAELEEVEDRLAVDSYVDADARGRDEQRRTSRRQLLERLDGLSRRARELVFEAERCATALTAARIELASLRAGDTQVDVDALVQTLEATINRVRDVQDELRRLGY